MIEFQPDYPRSSCDGDLVQLERMISACLRGQVVGFHLVPQEGGVTLQGRARSFYAKQLAQHAVMTLGQVQVVSNDIEVDYAEK